MSENAPYDPHVDGASAVSPGKLLRDARVASGMHIESIAFALKVPVSKIEALETDRWEALPDAVFARALASSVCRVLKLDPAPVLALLPQTTAHFLPSMESGVNAAFRDGSERSRSRSVVARVTRPLGLTVIVLLVGAAVLAWMPTAWLHRGLTEPIRVQSAETPEQSAPTAPAGTQAEVVPSTQVAPAAPVSAAGSSQVALSAASDPVSPSSPIANPTGNAPRLLMTASRETWVQVKDAQGAVLLERILHAGESAAVNQPGRLSVVVGRADATEVRVAGQKRDIAASARENVARFEVNP